MPTIIDSLIVQLGLDTKDVDSKAPGVRKRLSELERASSDVDKQNEKTNKQLKNLAGTLGSFLAVIGGTAAIKSFVRETIETNTQLYMLSRNLDMSTQKLFALDAAGQEIGGRKGTIQNFAKTIAEMPGQLLVGRMPQLLPLFARMGVSFREPFDQIMIDLAKRFAGMDRKTAFSFGIASGIPEDVLNLLLQGPGAVKSAIGRGAAWGPTGKEAESAARLKKETVDLELQFVKIGYDLLYKVTPYLERFLGLLQAIGSWAQKHEKIVALIAGVAGAIGSVVALASGIGAVSLAWTALSGAFAATFPIMAAVGAIAALGAGILLLLDDYKVWAQGGKSLFNWGDFAEGIDVVVQAFDDLAGKIERANEAYQKWLEKHGFATSAQQPALEQKALDAYNRAHPGTKEMRDTAETIAKKEGFYDSHIGFRPKGSGDLVPGPYLTFHKENIPQKAHNPGDIEYGPFAQAHGATGYVLAQGGKKIATFPNDDTGWRAMYALLGSKGYAGLSAEQVISRWQTGKVSDPISSAASLMNGIPNSSHVSALLSYLRSGNSSTSTDNSKTLHVGSIIIQNPAGTDPTTPSMARGMDWTTLLTQQNAGLF